MNVLDSKILGQVGLSNSEQIIYRTGLVNGPLISNRFIKITKMPRATVTAGLRVLQAKNLCVAERIDGRSYVYTMQPITNLKGALGKQARYLDSIIDRLDNIKEVSHSGNLINIQEFSGIEGTQDAIEIALNCSSRKWNVISPRNNALMNMPDEYKDYFKRVRKQRNIVSQSLWEHSSQADIPLEDILMRKPRYVPVAVARTIPSFILAFDNKILIIDYVGDKFYAVIIEGQSITTTFNIIFELAWRSIKK